MCAGMLHSKDDANVVKAMARKSRNSVKDQFILDIDQMWSPSCVQQLIRVLGLLDWGAEIRKWRRATGLFAALHANTTMVDR